MLNIVTIANYYKNKGLEYLIEAVKDLPVTLDIIGDGDYKPNLKGVSNVNLLGYIPDAYKLLPEYDLYVCSSIKEEAPFSILEAMRAGLPIVSTNVGSIPEMLKECGILFMPKDVKELKYHISYFIDNPEVAKSIGKNAKERQAKLYTKERMLKLAEDLHEILEKNIKKRPIIVQTNHGLPYKEDIAFYKKIVWKWLCKRAYKKCDHVICLSEISKQEMIDDGLTTEDKITVIYNGI